MAQNLSPGVLPVLLVPTSQPWRHLINALTSGCPVPVRFFALALKLCVTGTFYMNTALMLCLLQEHPITMNTSIHTQAAISTLSQAFAPLNCMIHAARKGSFSFTLVNEHGIARHSERLYPEQYESAEPLQAVIDRTRQALIA